MLTQETPQVIGQRVLLGQCDVDHGQNGALALEDAVPKERDDGVIDIVGIELLQVLRAKPCHLIR